MSNQKKEVSECICQQTAKEIIGLCRGLQNWALDLLERYPALDGEILYSLDGRIDSEVTRNVEMYVRELSGRDADEVDSVLEDCGADSRCCEADKHDLGPYSPGV